MTARDDKQAEDEESRLAGEQSGHTDERHSSPNDSDDSESPRSPGDELDPDIDDGYDPDPDIDDGYDPDIDLDDESRERTGSGTEDEGLGTERTGSGEVGTEDPDDDDIGPSLSGIFGGDPVGDDEEAPPRPRIVPETPTAENAVFVLLGALICLFIVYRLFTLF